MLDPVLAGLFLLEYGHIYSLGMYIHLTYLCNLQDLQMKHYCDRVLKLSSLQRIKKKLKY